MKKLILFLLIIFMITGCSNKPSSENITNDNETIQDEVVNENMLKPLMSDEEIYNLLPEELIDYTNENFGYLDLLSLKAINQDFSDLVFINYLGEEVKIADFKGQKLVIDFVANWCGYCKEFTKDTYTKLIEAFPDVTFLQVFIEGDHQEIDTFYAEANASPNKEMIIPEFSNSFEFLTKLGISSIPAFVLLDEDSVVKWSFVGSPSKQEFSKHLELAYGENDAYKLIGDDLLKVIQRNYLDVKNDLSDETIALVDSLKNDKNRNIFDEALYTDLAKRIRPTMIEDYNGKKITYDELKGHKILFNFFLAFDDPKTYNEDIFNTLNQVSQEFSDYIIINIGLKVSDLNPEIYFDTMPYNVPGYLISNNEDKINGEFYKLALVNAPSLYFIDEDGYVAGVLPGQYNYDDFIKAKDIFFNETPIYLNLK